jgi:hypothetical protein
MTPPPPVPFPAINERVLKAGKRFRRIHDARFVSTAFNPGFGAPTRFAPLLRPSAPAIPHMYAASNFECAAHETVFHEIQFDSPIKSIAKMRLDPLVLSTLRCRRDLRFASLFEPDLNAWRINRATLIDTFASAYVKTVAWALAIHQNSDVDGLIWTSRRCDPHVAMMLFGDRVDPQDLEEVDSLAFAKSRALRSKLYAFARRAGIDIV